jgi:hypothetical protein
MLKGSWEGADIVSTHLLRVLIIRAFKGISSGLLKIEDFRIE